MSTSQRDTSVWDLHSGHRRTTDGDKRRDRRLRLQHVQPPRERLPSSPVHFQQDNASNWFHDHVHDSLFAWMKSAERSRHRGAERQRKASDTSWDRSEVFLIKCKCSRGPCDEDDQPLKHGGSFSSRLHFFKMTDLIYLTLNTWKLVTFTWSCPREQQESERAAGEWESSRRVRERPSTERHSALRGVCKHSSESWLTAALINHSQRLWE